MDGVVTGFRLASAEVVRHLIASALLEPPNGDGSVVGAITLRPHQLEAGNRLVAMIRAAGGAMLAEPVGLGKTYTALFVAKQLGSAPIVIAIPASLHETWAVALADCGIDAELITHEALSRSARPRAKAGLVIVDESHRLRNPATRRYAALADMCARSRVLLVTATPIQNAFDDLAVQLALFLGRAVWTLSDADVARHIVRGASLDASSTPRVSGPHMVSLGVEDDCLEQLVALPPAVPAADESTAGALLLYSLVHQWTSSRAALVAALERRVARAIALSSALETGRRPTRAELTAWNWSGEALQLAFPELIVPSSDSRAEDVAAFLPAVQRHHEAVDALLQHLRRGPNPDDARAAALDEVRRRHSSERVIAFCHYAETVRALWSRLGREPGVAALTGAGAVIASGRVSRESVLRQFTPGLGGARRAERIDMLIATDVLSEGLNLQEASVVVHLDYPWNPARLDQRIGRVRRLGSRHRVVTVYALSPPASAERLLRVGERLREKLRLAERTVGVAGHILPSALLPGAECHGGVWAASSNRRGAAEEASDLRARLRHWFGGDARTSSPGLTELEFGSTPVVAAVESNIDGFLALVFDDGEPELVADIGGGIHATARTLLTALDAVKNHSSSIDEPSIRATIQRIEQWLDIRRGDATVDFRRAANSPARRSALARVARAVSRIPRHRRALIAPLASVARSVATAPLAEGAERVLDSLVRSDLADEAWLRSMVAFGELNARRDGRRSDDAGQSWTAAVLLLVKPVQGSPGDLRAHSDAWS